MHAPLLQISTPFKLMFEKELCIEIWHFLLPWAFCVGLCHVAKEVWDDMLVTEKEIFRFAATLFTSVKLCETSEDKLGWDKRDMTYKHLYHFRISLVNVQRASMMTILSLFFQEACVNKIVKFMGGEVRSILVFSTQPTKLTCFSNIILNNPLKFALSPKISHWFRSQKIWMNFWFKNIR